ncbi:acyltransferase family protein [Dyadobacter sp. MSC1_007]|jgi:exopolysaccharide production protein ExoZ|uniref:acyltransferase family protein n=1 Tax=Dyadobacter sp. MSC1_007 TaxID=2909264 RepID=UPI00202FFBB4|nr:acyltransferase [Dyadobacter sp. MSC1_007]
MVQEQNLKNNLRESKINSIQVLRGIAALIVTMYHLKDVMSESDPFRKEIDFLFRSGPAGVGLFFVISGFIMVYITRNVTPSWTHIAKFFLKRLIRIWPAYAVITLGYCFLQTRLSPNTDYLRDLLLSLSFIPLSNVHPPFYGYATLSVGWSLNYEIYFYCLLAFSLAFSRFRWPFFFLLIAITLIGIPALRGSFTFKPDQASVTGLPYLNMMTNPVIWNFVYGVIIGLLYVHPAANARMSAFFSNKWVMPTMVSLAVWQYLSGFFGGLGPFQWGMGSVALFTTFVFYYQDKLHAFPSWLVRLGDISFSIYLLHLPVVVGLSFLFHKIGYPVFSTGTAMFVLALSVTLIAADISYEYLEVRLSSQVRKWLRLF